MLTLSYIDLPRSASKRSPSKWVHTVCLLLCPVAAFGLGTTITLVSSPMPSAVFNQPVTLLASVSPASATGKVTFYDGTTILGVSTLAAGQAALNTTLLASGNKSLTALYGGDAVYTPSVSTSVPLIVFTMPSAGFVVAGGNPSPIGTSPYTVIVGDFNRDGRQDLAIANHDSNNVTVLLGSGSGRFTAARGSPVAVGRGPRSMVAADFNGDGNADLAVANGQDGTVTILLGNGSGGFTPATGSPLFLAASSLAVGDFNGDGKPDLALANSANNNVTVLLGNGNGDFIVAGGSPVTAGSGPLSIATGDFNRDGKADLAIANYDSSNVTVLLGNGTGGFAAASGGPFAVTSNAYSVAVGDFNGDGNPDLAVSNHAPGTRISLPNYVDVLLGNGSGGFTAASGSPFAAGDNRQSVAVADFNGDGAADLVVTGSGVTVLLGNGSGGFTPSKNNALAERMPASAVGVGDFNGDGRVDLALAGNNAVTVLLGSDVTAGPPFGHIDTPVDRSIGLAGAINFTGWALSRITIGRVALCRETTSFENQSGPGRVTDPRCMVTPPSPKLLVYLADAVLVPSVRPDVALAFPDYANNNWGWGAQILTNFLPDTIGSSSPGNGTYTLHAIAADALGLATDLGTTTISTTNAASVLPFGTIDTPAPGETISGANYINFGWVVTPQPNIVPIDGSTITVHVDGVFAGHPTYNNLRSDIATLFPGLKNSNGAVGFFPIDTTKLSNGIHSIDWIATDSAGHSAGLGSRYFFVRN